MTRRMKAAAVIAIPLLTLTPLAAAAPAAAAPTPTATTAPPRGAALQADPGIRAGGYSGRVSAPSGLRIRSMPQTGARIIALAPNKTALRAYCQTSRFGGRWYLVTRGQHTGYASAANISTGGVRVQNCSRPVPKPRSTDGPSAGGVGLIGVG